MQEVMEESLSNLDSSVIQSILIAQMEFPLPWVNAQARYKRREQGRREGRGREQATTSCMKIFPAKQNNDKDWIYKESAC